MARSECEKCKGEGLLPWTNKEGKIIPHARVYCECYEEEPEHFYPLQPEDIDFPISYSCYRNLCQQHGWPDPRSCEPPEHTIEELQERIATLEELSQTFEKPRRGVSQLVEKRKPKLTGGIKL